MRAHLLAPFVPVLLAAGLPVPPSAGAPRATAAEGTVVLESLDGTVKRLPLDGFSAADPRQFGAHLVRFEGIEPPKRAADPAPRDVATIELTSGHALRAEVVGGRAEVLAAKLVGDVPLRLPVDRIVAIRFEQRLPPDGGVAIAPAAEGDRLFRVREDGGRGVDRIDGTVLELGAEGVLIDSSIGEKRFPWSEVAALLFEVFAPGAGAVASPAVPATVDLIDGSRLAGGLRSLDGRGATLALSDDNEVTLPPSVIANVVVADDRLAWLSDLPAVEHIAGTPFGDDLGMTWPYRRDRTVNGGRLVADGRTWTRGLGVHAPSRLEFALDGSWKRLRAGVAIDDETAVLSTRGSVVFSLVLDGEVKWTSPVVRGGDRPLEVPALDLSGVKKLELVVDPTSDSFVADRADWLVGMLVR